MSTIKGFLLIVLVAILVQDVQNSNSQPDNELPQGVIATEYVNYFFPKLCYQDYFSKGDFNAPRNCYLKVLISMRKISSRLLSLINMIVVFFIRVPQIAKIIKERSVFGLSYFGNNLQFVMPAMTLGYGIYSQLPISIYIENLFITVQSFVILCLFFVYKQLNYQNDKNRMKFLLLLSITVSALFVFQLVPNYMQDLSIWLQLLVFFFGRGSQLLTNYRNKSTGTLSVLTVTITVSANLIRIFSIMMQAPGHIGYLLNYLIPFFVNSYILFQFYLYGNNLEKPQIKKEL